MTLSEMPEGFYWCTDCVGQRIVVLVEYINEGEPNQFARVWVTGEPVIYGLEDFSDYKLIQDEAPPSSGGEG